MRRGSLATFMKLPKTSLQDLKASSAEVIIVGAGLAGSECTWQLVKRGIRVALIEQRPTVKSEAHKTGNFAELVCSNSFKSVDALSAPPSP